jgi:peptidoglycan/xylan/chitin deacetylase (PgdA/CDA1 family)
MRGAAPIAVLVASGAIAAGSAPAVSLTPGPTGPSGPSGATGPTGPSKPPRPPSGCLRHGPAVLRHGPRARHAVALTFDDGPWPDTPQFVRVLERDKVPATFFMIGRQVAGHRALLRRELADGDALGNHSFTHPDLVRAGGVAAQLSETSRAIERAAGYRPCIFRPPFGSYDASVVGAALAQGMTTVVWDVDPRDWARPGTAAIVTRVLDAVRNGSVVLMHDGGGPRQQTLAALPQIIKALRRRGFAFRTVPELLGYAPVRNTTRRG